MGDLDLFKKYIIHKNRLKEFGYVYENRTGEPYVKTFEGEIITHLAYKSAPNPIGKRHGYSDKVGKLVKIAYATCGYKIECQIGKPKRQCVDNGIYSVNKCAVVFCELFNRDDFTLNFDLEELETFIEGVINR